MVWIFSRFFITTLLSRAMADGTKLQSKHTFLQFRDLYVRPQIFSYYRYSFLWNFAKQAALNWLMLRMCLLNGRLDCGTSFNYLKNALSSAQNVAFYSVHRLWSMWKLWTEFNRLIVLNGYVGLSLPPSQETHTNCGPFCSWASCFTAAIW